MFLELGGATADPRVAGYPDVRSRGDNQRPPDHGNTIRYWRTFTVDTSDAAYAKDTSRDLHDTGCLCLTEMEKVAILSRSGADEVE